MIFMKEYIVVVLLFAACSCVAQDNDGKVGQPSEKFPVIELPIVEAKDVMWHRRLWREIDLTEKINQHLYFPNAKEHRGYCMYDLLDYYLQDTLIKAYSADNDEFSRELSLPELNASTGDSLLVDGKMTYKPLNSRDVVKYWLKEDWFFDGKNSKVDVRITGICPVKVKKDVDGNVSGYEQLFWLYFPHIRGVLVNYEALKKEEESDPRVSFDDVFIKKRMFNSYIIVKEGNRLNQQKTKRNDLDIQLENEKTKYYHFDKASNLWK